MQLLNPTPDIRADHPVLVREVRRMDWLRRAGSPLRYLARRVLILTAVMMLLYAAWLVWWWLDSGYPYPYLQSFLGMFSNSTLNFIFIAGGVSLLAALPLDYTSIMAAVNSINSEVVSGTWDLLRLTAVREGELVLAKHAGAQLRAWRGMAIVIGLRAAVGLIVAVLFAFEFLHSTDRFGLEIDAPLAFLAFNLLPFALLYGVFTLEPLWRMRAVTALGLVISARSTDAAASALSALGALMAFWLAQVVMATAVFPILSVLMLSLSVFGVGALCAPLVMVLVPIAALYGFYSTLKTWSLRQVARRVASYIR